MVKSEVPVARSRKGPTATLATTRSGIHAAAIAIFCRTRYCYSFLLFPLFYVIFLYILFFPFLLFLFLSFSFTFLLVFHFILFPLAAALYT